MDSIGKVQDCIGKVSDGLRKVSDGFRMVLDGLTHDIFELLARHAGSPRDLHCKSANQLSNHKTP